MEARALQLKTEGNKHFQSGNYSQAESFYSQAISITPSNPILYTNRANARLKLRDFKNVVSDCELSLQHQAGSMKAHFFMAQAQLELPLMKTKALKSAQAAYERCKADSKLMKDMSAVGALVLRAKKEVWELKESERLDTNGRLEQDLIDLLRQKWIGDGEVWIEAQKSEGHELSQDEAAKMRKKNADTFEADVAATKQIFADAARAKGDEARREVPDYIIDDISFSIMHDPVVTKTGHSYERVSILEHLKRSETDPLTRAPLTVAELRPNLALKQICDDFLRENGWAVDW